MTRLNPQRWKSQAVPLVAAATLSAMGVAVIVAWHLRSEWLVRALPGLGPMQLSTAGGFILCGLGLAATVMGFSRTALTLGIAVTTIGLIDLVEFLYAVYLGIDRVLVEAEAAGRNVDHRGLMAPTAAACFILVGVALTWGGEVLGRVNRLAPGLLSEQDIDKLKHEAEASVTQGVAVRNWALGVVGWVGGVVAILGAAAAMGYFGGQEPSDSASLTRMAFHTSCGFIVLGCSLSAYAWTEFRSQTASLVRWLPGIVGLVSLLVSVLLWQTLRAHDQSRVAGLVEADGRLAAALLEAELRSRIAEVGSNDPSLLEPRKILGQSLPPELASGYTVLLEAGGTALASAGVEDPEPVGGFPTLTLPVTAGETAWTLHLRPTPLKIARMRTLMPSMALLTGLLVSVLLAFTSRAIQVGRWRAEELERSRDEARAVGLSLDRNVAERTRQLENARTAAMSLAMDAQQAQKRAEEGLQALRRSEARIESFNHELRQRNEEMSRFVYTVSHDLKTPLVTMLGFVTLMMEDLRNGRTGELLGQAQRIERAARKMERLIADLLQLSRIGRTESPPQEIDTTALVGELCESLAIQIKAADARVVVLPPLPRVNVDRTRLTQVFENLLTNALKYGCEGEKKLIEVGGEVTAEGPSFFVRDFGSGIGKEFHEKVFGLFTRLHNDNRGTGAGLAIVRRIMQVCGGRCWVESEPGKGATFRFVLPKAFLAHEDASPLRPGVGATVV